MSKLKSWIGLLSTITDRRFVTESSSESTEFNITSVDGISNLVIDLRLVVCQLSRDAIGYLWQSLWSNSSKKVYYGNFVAHFVLEPVFDPVSINRHRKKCYLVLTKASCMITPKRPLYNLFQLFNCNGRVRLRWALDQSLSRSAFPTILRPRTVYNKVINWKSWIDLQLESFKRVVNNLTICKQRHRNVVLSFIYSLRTLETWKA